MRRRTEETAKDVDARIGIEAFLLQKYYRPAASSRSTAPPTDEEFCRVSNGRLKVLYSDFAVREIPRCNTGGDVPPKPLRLEALLSCEGGPLRESAQQGPKLSVDAEGEAATRRVSALKPFLSEHDVSLIQSAIQGTSEGGPFARVQLKSSSSLDKSQRKELHQIIKEHFSKWFISHTIDGVVVLDEATTESLRAQAKRSVAGSARGQQVKPPYLHFTLYKENLDSHSALRQIATHLGINSKELQISGTKDKRGVTLQRVACRHIDVLRLSRLNQRRYGRNATAKIGADVAWSQEGLTLGDLIGNNFTIIVRHQPDQHSVPTWEHDEVSRQGVCKFLEKQGFPNFFGPQRFGTTRILTSDIGLCILSHDYAGALRLIFRSRVEISPETSECLRGVIAEPSDEASIALAQQSLPHYCFHEKDILRSLCRSPQDLLGAILCLPRTLVMLYCHSVQSLIWNKMVSQRLQRGQSVLSAIEGDLVLLQSPTVQGTHISTQISDELTEELCPTVAVADGDEAAEDTPQHVQGSSAVEPTCPAKIEEKSSVAGKLPVVRSLSKEDVLSGRFSLRDVVLPLPGPDPELVFPQAPTHPCTRESYVGAIRSLLAPPPPHDPTTATATGVPSSQRAENLITTLLSQSDHHLVKLLHFHGAYRPLLCIPWDVSLETIHYNHRQPATGNNSAGGPLEPVLSPTDLERLTSQGAVLQRESDQLDQAPTAPSVATKISFSLPTGSYATSLLRELFELSDC